MHLSKALRRTVAGIVAVLFLACQGMAIVYARSLDAARSGAEAAQVSCHDAGLQTDSNTPKSTCQANCDSQHASSTPSGAYVHAAADLPAITTHTNRIAAVAGSAPYAEPPLLRVESPPFRTLHCCLRN